MSEVSRTTADAAADVIHDETGEKLNTAERIGQMFRDIIDSAVWNNKGIASSRPASSTVTGDHYFATDTGVLSIWDGSDWVEIGAGADQASEVTDDSTFGGGGQSVADSIDDLKVEVDAKAAVSYVDSQDTAVLTAAATYTDDEISSHEGAADPHEAYVLAEPSATDHAIVRWDGSGGRAVQNTANAILTDAGQLTLGSGAIAQWYRAQSNFPALALIKLNATSGQRWWHFEPTDGRVALQAWSDDGLTPGGEFISFERSGLESVDTQAHTRYGDVQLAPVYSVTEGETDESITVSTSAPFNLLGSALNLGTIADGYKYVYTVLIHVTPDSGTFEANEDMDQDVVSFEAVCTLFVVRRAGGSAQLSGVIVNALDDYYTTEEAPPGTLQNFFEALDLQVDLTSNVLTIQPQVGAADSHNGALLSVQVDASYMRTPAPAIPTEVP